MKGFTNRTAKEPSEDSFVRGFGFSPQTGGKYKVGQHLCALGWEAEKLKGSWPLGSMDGLTNSRVRGAKIKALWVPRHRPTWKGPQIRHTGVYCSL